MFFSLVDCHLGAQIANFGLNGPEHGPASTGIVDIDVEKISVGERDDKLEGSLNRFYISTVYNS